LGVHVADRSMRVVGTGVVSLSVFACETDDLFPFMGADVSCSVIPCFHIKQITHYMYYMYDLRSIVSHICLKVFTNNQISQIKYNYYISNRRSSTKRNSGRLHNYTGMTTGAIHNIELLIEEFQSTFSF
jgi:hypothetical protein